ncbi:thioredoxin family protein [Desmonostoc muscorum LEGE 12446]|uniref:Thioredoxin n=1 Tax=Desmonostoc muscorum LEGE 12446 TaxID=1828758 RepID=A0A8J6ZWN7_DESMC|nr:thioredoxin domain-containing protein [Desmonostoc muscorum]MCF2149177.1 thioredoxin family protein [Desmonostoc muscorum LEGE 12446]
MTIKQQFQDFRELLSSSHLPLLLVFYSYGCGSCHLIDSVLEEVNKQMKQQLTVVKIDSDVYPDLANQYQVHPLPTLLLFKNGQLVERIEEERSENLIPAERLIHRLEALV